MKHKNNITTVTTVRILRSQAAALEKLRLTNGTSASALIRVLLQEYFEKHLPQVEELISKEEERIDNAVISARFQKTKVA